MEAASNVTSGLCQDLQSTNESKMEDEELTEHDNNGEDAKQRKRQLEEEEKQRKRQVEEEEKQRKRQLEERKRQLEEQERTRRQQLEEAEKQEKETREKAEKERERKAHEQALLDKQEKERRERLANQKKKNLQMQNEIERVAKRVQMYENYVDGKSLLSSSSITHKSRLQQPNQHQVQQQKSIQQQALDWLLLLHLMQQQQPIQHQVQQQQPIQHQVQQQQPIQQQVQQQQPIQHQVQQRQPIQHQVQQQQQQQSQQPSLIHQVQQQQSQQPSPHQVQQQQSLQYSQPQAQQQESVQQYSHQDTLQKNREHLIELNDNRYIMKTTFGEDIPTRSIDDMKRSSVSGNWFNDSRNDNSRNDALTQRFKLPDNDGSNRYESRHVFQAQMETIMNCQRQMRLPVPEVKTFSGNAMDYHEFIQSFEARVLPYTSSTSDLLYYLDQYLEGKAKTLIRGCLKMKADEGYDTARKCLEREYGDPILVSNAYMQKLQDWPSIRADDPEGLKDLSIYMNECCHAMGSLKDLSHLDHTTNLKSIMDKLPNYVQNKWLDTITVLKRKEGRLPTFKDLSDFVD